DLHIPVRLFAVQVVDTLPVRKALTLAPVDIVTELAKNAEGFVLVPAVIGRQGARVVNATAGGAAVNIAPLQALIQPAPATLPADIQAFVGTGGVLSLKHTPALNISADTVVELQVEVGAAAPFAQLKITITLKP
ncbi:MAG TPA: hypothetical protein VFT99_08050, partial [Roseiflexaceae bacterium]|nr:hypothetical protein [Roseiflexaceae bacterium]